ncbi:MAG TPA: hypothetical protein VM717_06995 [Chthoniobacterales bacterium]|jgi:hypothetical protein|nr:hypothetical protein [Chthoniobacterales bacterium]
MKVRSYLAIAVAMVSTWVLAGCANNEQSANSTNADASAKTYSSEDLQRTGKRDAGEALRAADPSVTTTGGR